MSTLVWDEDTKKSKIFRPFLLSRNIQNLQKKQKQIIVANFFEENRAQNNVTNPRSIQFNVAQTRISEKTFPFVNYPRSRSTRGPSAIV